ncbi:hypothetical protein FACS1894187_21590 [Synergistales bacterium]|nr:hypothetical protein FACS1894187_21590 [Synergistales bacterium]
MSFVTLWDVDISSPAQEDLNLIQAHYPKLIDHWEGNLWFFKKRPRDSAIIIKEGYYLKQTTSDLELPDYTVFYSVDDDSKTVEIISVKLL